MNLEPLLIGLVFVCLATVVYSYIVYPVLIWVFSRLFGRPPEPPQTPSDADLPTVTLLIAAYNEEREIAARVENALAEDYPAGKLQVVVASDGSDDATCEIVRRYQDRGVILLDYRSRRGKPAVLNSTVPELQSEIVVFSDANSLTEPHAIRRLVRWFQDPAIGAVCGRLVLTDPATGRNVDSLYWKYETFLKKCESRLGALLGSNGAIYALRRSLYPAIPDNTIVEDFVIPLAAKQNTGCRIIYDRDAVACELTPENIQAEFRRRARIGAGGFQSIGLLWRVLNPLNGWVAFTFLSHKVLRWIGPFLLITAFVANSLLLHRAEYRWLFCAQIAFYLLALATAWLPPRPRALRFLRLTTMFTSMNAALLVGFFRWLRGTQSGAWQRTTRDASEGANL